jgi:hypothetical protein
LPGGQQPPPVGRRSGEAPGAEQVNGPDGLRLLQRQIGKPECGRKAGSCRHQQRLKMESGLQTNADGLSDKRQDEIGHRSADQNTATNPDKGQRSDLGEEVQEHPPVFGAHAAQDGDNVGTFGNVGLHTGPHAHAADQ